MTSTAEHMAARDDRDLIDRFIAAAELLSIPEARTVIVDALPALISQQIEVNGESTTVASVYAWASSERRKILASDAALPPGRNPSAVTDDHLRAAVLAVLSPDAAASV